MRSMVYKSVSVMFVVAIVIVFMAAHHEKESDDLASLKATHNLHWKGWESADMETHFSTVHPEGSGVFPNGDLASDMKILTMTDTVTALRGGMRILRFRWTT